MKKSDGEIKELLDNALEAYHRPEFIEEDPISIPHQYSLLQDIEISAFWTAMFSWGKRKTIINKANDLFERMDFAPYDFIKHHGKKDLKGFENFAHRTFQPKDIHYFLKFFQWYYKEHNSLETAFISKDFEGEFSMKKILSEFHNLFFSLPNAPQRTRKHVATPIKGSACKRINMFLRWMVRCDQFGIDFGLWDKIHPKDLIIPLDIHVSKIAHYIGLIDHAKNKWKTACDLTEKLRIFSPDDPVKYDYALFMLGVKGVIK